MLCYAMVWYDEWKLVCFGMRFQCYSMRFQCNAMIFQCYAIMYVCTRYTWTDCIGILIENISKLKGTAH